MTKPLDHISSIELLIGDRANDPMVQAEFAFLRASVTELERQQREVSDIREAFAYRLEKVWEIGPEVIGDLLSWECHKPSEATKEMAMDLFRTQGSLKHLLTNFEALLAGKPVRDAEETIAEAHAALNPESK